MGADAPRPPSCSLPVNAPERKVTGPLVVSWAGTFLVLCGMGVLVGTGRAPSELRWPFRIVWWVRRGNSVLCSSLKLGFFVSLGSILHLQTGNPDLSHVEGGLFYEGPFSQDLPSPCPREVSFFL